MAQNSANTFVVKTGSIWMAPLASVTAPTAVDSVLDTDLVEVGYIGADGITETYEVTTESVTAFQNGDTVDSSVTEAEMTLTATFIEIGNATATEAFYGDAVDPDDGSVLVSPGATSGRRAFVVDLIAGTRRIRYWIPEGELTKDGDVTYQNGQPAGYPVRITCYPSTTLVKADGTSASAKRWSSQLVVTP